MLVHAIAFKPAAGLWATNSFADRFSVACQGQRKQEDL